MPPPDDDRNDDAAEEADQPTARARRRRPRRLCVQRPALTVEQILAWADAHFARWGAWPTNHSGPVADTLVETWGALSAALTRGRRGLPGGSSLARLLAERRGRRNIHDQPPLTEDQILAWADAHHAACGAWPNATAGPVRDAAGETWANLDQALRVGLRSLAGGTTLTRLLAARRDVRNRNQPPAVTEEHILAWADAHRDAAGDWPTSDSGPVAAKPGETWPGIDHALREGLRGLPGGSSLARLLAARRGRRNRLDAPPLTVAQVVAWAADHLRHTGRLPTAHSGAIDGADDTWNVIDWALRNGKRGLPSAGGLHSFLVEAGLGADGTSP